MITLTLLGSNIITPEKVQLYFFTVMCPIFSKKSVIIISKINILKLNMRIIKKLVLF